MKIVIETNGFSDKTKIEVNGENVTNLTDFYLSLKHPGKIKMSWKKVNKEANRFEKSSFFGSDIQEYDNGEIKTPVSCIGESEKKEEVKE